MPSQTRSPSASSGSFSGSPFSAGGQNWTNPSAVYASDDSRAYGVVQGAPSKYTKGLIARNFGFSIPTGSVINGIEVVIERQGDENYIRDQHVVIMTGSSSVGGARTSTDYWPVGTDESKTYGGNSDLWDESWTSSDINDYYFGVAISAYQVAGSGDTYARIDHISITVYYTEPTTADLAEFSPTRIDSVSATITDKVQLVEISPSRSDSVAAIRTLIAQTADSSPTRTDAATLHPTWKAQAADSSPAREDAAAATITRHAAIAEASPARTDAGTLHPTWKASAAETSPARSDAATATITRHSEIADASPARTDSATLHPTW